MPFEIHHNTSIQKVFDQAPVAIAVLLGPQFVLYTANQRQLALWQKSSEYVLNKPLLEVLPEIASQDFVQLLNNVYNSGESYSATEMPAQFLRNGTLDTGWFDFTYEPLFNEVGHIEGIIVVSTEVTEKVIANNRQKEAEKALHVRNSQLNLLARTAEKLIGQNSDEVVLLRTIFDDIFQTLDLEIYFNYVPNKDNTSLLLKTSGGISPAEQEHYATIEFGEQLCGRVAAQLKRIVLEDISNSSFEGSDALVSAGATAYAGFPLLVGGRLIGTVSFATRKRTHFQEGEIQTIQTVCDQLAAMIEAQRLNLELAESHERFQVIFNHQYQLSGLLTPDGNIIDVCDSAVRLAGTSKEGLLGQKFVEAPWFQNMPEAQALWMEQFEEAKYGQFTSRREAPYNTPDGSLGYALNTATAIRNMHGVVQYLLVEGIDITEQKKIEQSLIESEERFRSLFRYSPVSKWIEDFSITRNQIQLLQAAGVSDFDVYFAEHPNVLNTLVSSIVVKDVNDASLQLYEGVKEDLLQGLQNFFVEETLLAFIQQIKVIAAGGGRYEAETVIKAKSGSLKNVLVRVDFPPDGDYSNLIVALLDITERKKMEQRLKEQYDELQNIYQNAPIGLAMVDRNLQFVRINERLAEINGMPAKDHVGKPIEEVVPDLAVQAKAIFRQVFDTGKAVLDVEINGQTKAQPGVERTWKESWYPVQDDNGEVLAVSIVVEEITDRKVAEEALRQSEEQMRLVLDASKTGMWIVDMAKEYIYWSPQQYSIFGVTEFDGQIGSFTKLVHPDDLPHVQAAFSAAVEHGGQYKIEFRIIQPSGDVRWVGNYGYCEYGEDARPVRFLGLAQDITERKEAEQALIESEARFRSMAEALPQMVWTADTNGAILYASNYWKEYSGIEDINASWHYMIHPEDMLVVTANWNNSLAFKQPYRQELRLRDKSGVYRWHYSIGEPIMDENGTLLKWVGAMTDIHVQKVFSEQLEALVAERTRELKRSNEDLQQFAHVSSHDLKEPVRKTLTFVSRLESEFDHMLPDRAKHYLKRINAASRRSYDMIEGVLRYSMLDTVHSRKVAVDLKSVFQAIEVDLELSIAEKNADLLYSDLPVVEGHEHLLHQLFYNLVGNALKFAKADIHTRISIDWHEATVTDKIRLNISERVRFACIRVQDNGIGFNQQYAYSLFDTFTRLNPKDNYEGTGIGLALCKKIVVRHGGAIEAEGQEGYGAVFTVYLPLP